jgi:hypothetical protein
MNCIRQIDYSGHGVESSESLSASYLPCDAGLQDLDSELSGVPYRTWVDSVYQRPKAGVLSEIETQCRAMLKDVADTNEKAKSLSAFMSVFAFLGILAKLSFAKNSQYNFQDQFDLRAYLTLIDRFILGYTDTLDPAVVANRHGLAEVLYRKVRCGLLHGGTLLNKKVLNDEKIVVRLSHSQKDARSLREIDSAIISLQRGELEAVRFIVGAEVMFGEIKKVINAMFHGAENQGADPKVTESILEVYKNEPFVVDPNYLKSEEEIKE